MYSRRRRSGPGLGIIILLGVIVGVGFLIYENFDRLPFFNNTPEESQFQAVSSSSTGPEASMDNVGSESVGVPQTTENQNLTASGTSNSPDIPQDTTLFIPSAGIYSSIVQVYLDGVSWDVSRLGVNVGHLEGTPWLGQGGNVVLSGHVELSDGRQGVFSNLDELQVGDVIVVQENGQEYTYSITEVYITTPEDLTPLRPSTTNRLTLITCGSYDFFQDAYLERTIVVADLIG